MNNTGETPQYNRRPKSALIGLLIIGIGILILLQRMGFYVPEWIFTWEVALILIGLYVGFRRSFRDRTSFVLIGIGLVFLARHLGWIPPDLRQYWWPAIIIVIGLVIMFRPGRNYNGWQDAGTQDASNDTLESIAIFWGSRKNVLSKDFKKGEVVNIFGGTEINFNQADINGTANLEVVAIFGGVKIIVPRDWDVRVNVVHVFAGTNDKRNFPSTSGNNKVLTLTGVAIFGGVDIVSY